MEIEMSFTTHTKHMKNFCDTLKKLSQKSPTEQHLHDLLEYLCANEALFEASVSDSSPFYQEFFSKICGHTDDADVYFDLLECLIVFCRERQLRHNAQEELSAVEKQLLDFFEQSHHWHKEDRSLIQQWYWHTLPGMYAKA